MHRADMHRADMHQADVHLDDGDPRALFRRALAGQNLDVDGEAYPLHDLTQIALGLQPQACLAIRHAGHMSPLEKASIASVGRGRVVFL